MTLHMPTHPARYVGHHYLRDALLIVGAAALALILGIALVAIKPVSEPSTTLMTSTELWNQFRAEERSLWAAPVSDTQRWNDFRAEERSLYGNP
jgi:hypothetical protein